MVLQLAGEEHRLKADGEVDVRKSLSPCFQEYPTMIDDLVGRSIKVWRNVDARYP